MSEIMKLKPFPPEDEAQYAPEGPEDRALRIESSAEARLTIEAFAAAHYQELADLIVTYGDAVAEDKLSLLRELFWSATPPGSK